MEDSSLLYSFFVNRSVRDPERTAIFEYDSKERVTYRELVRNAGRVAAFLKMMGLEKGDRVALCSRNAHWCFELLYAMPVTGTVLTTYNIRLKSQELNSLLVCEAPKVLFYESFYAEKVSQFKLALPDTLFVVLDDDNPFGDITYRGVLDREPWNGAWAELGFEDICMLCHTGGTTGTPKAAKISYRSIFYNTLNQVLEYSTTAFDIMYVSFPLFHIAAWSTALSILQSGGCIIFKKVFDTDDTLRMIENERMTIISGSPAVYQRLSKSPLFDKTDFSSIRCVRCGAAPPSREIMEPFWKKGLVFLNVYGMTESGTGILSLPIGSTTIDTLKEKAGSAGKPMIFAQVRIVDDDGNDVRPGEPGELLVKSGMLFTGYWQNEEETRSALQDGWLHTGDMARCDSDGFYYICGRKKHMYITYGENIFPLEIENFIMSWPETADCYVFGVPDKERGEVGKALIALAPGAALSEDEIMLRLKGQLSTIKVPRYIQIVDHIPRNEVGKVLTSEVYERYSLHSQGE